MTNDPRPVCFACDLPATGYRDPDDVPGAHEPLEACDHHSTPPTTDPTPVGDLDASLIDALPFDPPWFASTVCPTFETATREECSAFLARHGWNEPDDPDLDDLRDTCRDLAERTPDIWARAMRAVWPIGDDPIDLGEAQRKLDGLGCAVLTEVQSQDPDDAQEWRPVLALRGGGMDLTEHLVDAYDALGYLPPAALLPLPRMAESGGLTPQRARRAAIARRVGRIVLGRAQALIDDADRYEAWHRGRGQ